MPFSFCDKVIQDSSQEEIHSTRDAFLEIIF